MCRFLTTLVGMIVLTASLQAQEGTAKFVVPVEEETVILEPIEQAPEKKEEPKYPTWKLTGFFHLDAARFSQDSLNLATVGDAPDGLAFRRARLAVTGNLTDAISYIMELDFSNTQPRFVDMWVDFDKVPLLGHVRIGRWRQPFGMTEVTSIRELPFMERPLPFALAPFRQTGIGFYDHSENERATWAVSGYRHLTDFFGNVVGDNGGYGVAARGTILPLDLGKNRIIHLGGGYTWNDPARDQLIFFSPPEVFVAQSLALFNPAPIDGTPPFVSTGLITAENYQAYNLEAAAGNGPFVVQSELRYAMIKQPGFSNVTIPAYYVYARYVLTGETIPYDRKQGVFRLLEPLNPVGSCGGLGAWEIAARYSYIDLDGTIGPGPGRSLSSFTFGVNWYLNKFVKFQFNYIRAHLTDMILGSSNADIFAFRTQINF